MSIDLSYSYSSLHTLYDGMHCGVPFSVTWFVATALENLSLSFAFREGIISSLILSAAILSPTN